MPTPQQDAILHPISRYFGGKFRIAPWIIEHFPPHDRYVEPFGGMGSVLLRKEPAKIEVFNDLDNRIFNLFSVLRDPVRSRELRRLIMLTAYSRAEFMLSYEYSTDPIESARRFLVRLGMAISPESPAMNKTTGFRVTYGGHTTHTGSVATTWSTKAQTLRAVTRRLSGVIIEHEPAEKVFARYDSPATLFYCDPPYLPSTRASSGRYGIEMAFNDHRNLLSLLKRAQGKVVISGYPSDLYDTELSDWSRVERPDNSWRGGKRTEVLWIKP